MASRTPELTLLLPGLTASLPGMEHPGFPWPVAPALARLLSRADVGPAEQTLEDFLFRKLTEADAPPWPLAAVRYLGDTGRSPPGPLLCADPVHLRADHAELRLFDARLLDIEAGEAAALAAAFADSGIAPEWRLEVVTARRWYLHLPESPAIETRPPAAVIGRHIDAYLPQGPQARDWLARLNEVQMLFHAHPVNQARAEQGRPTINGLWPWGGSAALPLPRPAPWSRFWTEAPLGRGLARLGGLEARPLPTSADDWLNEAGGRGLLWLDGLETVAARRDLDGWRAALESLEGDWFAPLLDALAGRRLGSLHLVPGDGREYRVDRRRLRRFWRPLRPLQALLRS
ncbi:hypothetical protein QVG61_07745 [Thiohalobacter sp. IOR34]|uniref:hypothetical protein n=1 Tax=Thiohalobacter sp. IOR34 TaxID=3057176 RepID=UPI0025B1EF74|nr:hypothetical protein [Thiohalobacter sp. IOR34]WJW74410.1 hypothetical protein QVG61_07745 [Thiohalobacter sp. IOR34]